VTTSKYACTWNAGEKLTDRLLGGFEFQGTMPDLEHNAQKLQIVGCVACAHKRALRECGHIAWAASSSAELLVTRKDNLMTVTPPAAREAKPRIRAFVPPLLLAAAGAVAIAIAPSANADSTAPECTFTGNASVCQTDGNAQVSALPQENDYQQQYVIVGDDGYRFRHRG
jgi:hypothetical protein